MQKPRDSFTNHLSVNLQPQKPHRHPWDNHYTSGSDTATEEGNLAAMDVSLRPLLSSTATTSTPSSTPSSHSSSTARLTRPIGTAAFNNYRQHLKKCGPYELCCEVLDNQQGKIIVDGALTIYCSQLKSAHGLIAANGPIRIVCHEFCNANGGVQSHISTITITSRYALCNQQGQILSQSDIILSNPHARFDNSQGSVISKGSLQVTGGALTNRDGLLQAEQALNLVFEDDLAEQNSPLCGKLLAGSEATLSSSQALAIHGQLQGKMLRLTAMSLTNQGQITGEQINLTLKERLINREAAAIQAEKKLEVIAGNDCCNEGNLLAGQQVTIQCQNLNVSNKGLLQAQGKLTITAQERCDNEGQLLAGKQLTIQAYALHNGNDGLLQAPWQRLRIETYLSSRGTIKAQHAKLQAHTFSNFFKVNSPGCYGPAAALIHIEKSLELSDCYECYNEGEIQAGEQLSFHARTIHNHKTGKIQAPTMELTGGREEHNDGFLWSGGDVSNHGSIEMRNGLMRARTVFNGSNGQVYADDRAPRGHTKGIILSVCHAA